MFSDSKYLLPNRAQIQRSCPKKGTKVFGLPGFAGLACVFGWTVEPFRKGSPEDAALKLPEKWEEDIKIHQMYLLRHQNHRSKSESDAHIKDGGLTKCT